MTRIKQPGSGGPAKPDLLRDFIDFYKTTVHRTFGSAYRAAGRDTDVAQEATQEAYLVMLKLWLDNERPEGDLRRYVVGIAVHKVADHYRRDHYVAWEEDHDCGTHETGYAEVLGTMTVLHAVREFLDRQPPRRRAVGVLYFLVEFDYSEIAATLDMSCSTVRTHVQRLREALQPLIDQVLDDGGGERP
jgi:RNA polymerase sigma factor (sigma-70 family)